MNLHFSIPEIHVKAIYQITGLLPSFVVVFLFFVLNQCAARRNTIKLLSGSDRGNQKSLVLQNVINVPQCLEVYETNAINQLPGTAVARHHFFPVLPPSCPASLTSFPLSLLSFSPIPTSHLPQGHMQDLRSDIILQDKGGGDLCLTHNYAAKFIVMQQKMPRVEELKR